jgi:glycerol-3-phosphate dehydrogenase
MLIIRLRVFRMVAENAAEVARAGARVTNAAEAVRVTNADAEAASNVVAS